MQNIRPLPHPLFCTSLNSTIQAVYRRWKNLVTSNIKYYCKSVTFTLKSILTISKNRKWQTQRYDIYFLQFYFSLKLYIATKTLVLNFCPKLYTYADDNLSHNTQNYINICSRYTFHFGRYLRNLYNFNTNIYSLLLFCYWSAK